ncbi:MAG: hypothetical protein FWF72_05885 [Paludibacter sp.]|nr:hypothetical protein [Paludibacter sp.]
MTENSGKILQKIGNRTPFSVPEGYFEQFAGGIMPFISAQNKRPARIFEMRRWFVAAAAMALLISVGFMSYRSYEKYQIAENQDNYETYLMSQIDNNNLMEYYFTSYDE